jgi:hypothetical protein
MPARRAGVRAMIFGGVCLILCAALLLCADAILVIGTR